MSAGEESPRFSGVMPAEWEKHRATWIAWPHEESDWPGRLEAVRATYLEVIQVLAQHELVEILVPSAELRDSLSAALQRLEVSEDFCRLHLVPNDRSWLRDSGPTAVHLPGGETAWVCWGFNAWGRYDNYHLDAEISRTIAQITGKPRVCASRRDGQGLVILEGGAIDTDGEGTLLVTEECLLSSIQERNPGFGRDDYEQVFKDYLGIEKTIWLPCGFAGDDTHGHIDTLARFVAPNKVVLAFEENPDDVNYQASLSALESLRSATDAQERVIEVIKLPMPRPIFTDGERLPATYANFYLANGLLLVPTFRDDNDDCALQILSTLFPERKVQAIDCLDLVLGQGTLHCATQQEPADEHDYSIASQ